MLDFASTGSNEARGLIGLAACSGCGGGQASFDGCR